MVSRDSGITVGWTGRSAAGLSNAPAGKNVAALHRSQDSVHY